MWKPFIGNDLKYYKISVTFSMLYMSLPFKDAMIAGFGSFNPTSRCALIMAVAGDN